jgi:succinyl-CoA synthetase alpha subunit
MGILINKKTRVITQGISGKAGKFHTEQCLEYGSDFVGGVTPGKGGQEVLGLPIFDTVYESMKAVKTRCYDDFCSGPLCCKRHLRS